MGGEKKKTAKQMDDGKWKGLTITFLSPSLAEKLKGLKQ